MVSEISKTRSENLEAGIIISVRLKFTIVKKHILIIYLFCLTACGVVTVKTTNQSGKENGDMVRNEPVSGLSSEDWEKKLIASVGKYLQAKDAGASVKRPVIATNETEIARLKAAWAGSGEAREVLAKRFAAADKAIAAGLTFPPEGGQHNQWYQCDSCQIGLKTIDEHHHQCPSCNRVYSGFPYDNVLYNRRHNENLRAAEDAAWAWTVTGEQKYADFARAVLVGYADRYLNYPLLHTRVNDKSVDIAAEKQGKYRTAGRLQAQTLSEAAAMMPAATAYDLIYNTLDTPQRKHIEKNFLAAMAENINGYKSGKSNWQTWHNAAIMYVGAITGDGNLIRQALLDEENGFIAQMKISVMPEGMWYENSWGYHYYTLSAMTHLAEGSRRLGFDLYGFPQLRKMYLLAFDYLMGDGSLPRFGDAVQDTPFGKSVNEKAYAVYQDKRLLAALSPGYSWDAIALGRDVSEKPDELKPASTLIPGAGHAILATDGPGKLTAAFSFGPYGGFHGHFDKLSFVLFGFGEELAVDPGRSASQAYRLPIHREWYKATTGHNAVLVDGNSQNEADGEYLAFKSTSSHAAVTASAGPAFEQVSHIRFMMLSPDYLVVIDELSPKDGREHQYDWLYHNKGNTVTSTLPREEIALGDSPAGYAYLEDIRSFKSRNGEPLVVNFQGEEVRVHMKMAGEPGDELFLATGPLRSVEDRVPMAIVRRKGKTVRFATVLEPVAATGAPKVKDIRLIEGPEFKVIVDTEGGEDYITFTEGKLDRFKISKHTAAGSKTLLEN